MEFSTFIIILIYALTFRIILSSVLIALIKLLFRDEPKAYSLAFDRYLTRKSAYKMIMTLSYVIILNVVSSLDYPIPQSLWLVGMLILIEVTVFIYYELPSYGYSELKNGLGHYRWFIV
jgi:uncharacterized membrane protein